MTIYVCNRCGQRLEPGGRCNSGYHQGPGDDNDSPTRGVAVALHDSKFVEPWDPDETAGPWLRETTKR